MSMPWAPGASGGASTRWLGLGGWVWVATNPGGGQLPSAVARTQTSSAVQTAQQAQQVPTGLAGTWHFRETCDLAWPWLAAGAVWSYWCDLPSIGLTRLGHRAGVAIARSFPELLSWSWLEHPCTVLKDALRTHWMWESLFQASTSPSYPPFFQNEMRLGLNLWDAHYI